MLDQPRVEPTPREQLDMRARLDYPARIEHQDDVGCLYGGQPMRHHDRGAVHHQRTERGPHKLLADRVEMRGGLVEHQDRRVLQEGARDGDALSLTAGKLHATLAHARPQTIRQLGHELREGGLAQRELDLLTRRIGLGEADVRLQRVVEQIGVLRDQGDAAAKAIQRQFAQIDAIQPDRTLFRVPEAQQQIGDGGLAGP